MKLKYIGKPGPYIDLQTRTKWAPGETREVNDHMISSRLVGSGLFTVEKDEMPSENKMTSPLRRKRDDA